MNYAEIQAKVEREEDEAQRQREERQARRLVFRKKLLGADDAQDWQAPPPLEDLDATLGEHAAQLRNATRYIMEYVISDEISLERNQMMVGALTRLVQTNIAIAKVLGANAPRAKSKTVHGVRPPEEPQD